MKKAIRSILTYLIYPLLFLWYRKSRTQFPYVIDSINTLKYLIATKKSFSRFGDGEFALIQNRKIGFQNTDSNLSLALLRVLKEPSDKCLIGIPNVFNGMPNMTWDAKSFWIYKLAINWNQWKGFFTKQQYYDSLSSRFYIDIKDKNISLEIVDLWKKIWLNRTIVIIEGSKTKMGVGNDLFDNAKKVYRIICPSKNAFEKYNLIFESCLQLEKDVLILIALGPTASILAFDLSKHGFQAIDTGHLDLEYNWLNMHARTKMSVAGRAVNELNSHDAYIEIIDNNYNDQIITTID